VRDDRAVMPDQGVHATQCVLPIVLGEVTGEGGGDHLADVLPSLAIEIGGVDQAGGVYLGGHTPCLPVLSTGSHYENGEAREPPCARARSGARGRAQCNRTYWPGRTWATLSMSSSITTPTTGYMPVTG